MEAGTPYCLIPSSSVLFLIASLLAAISICFLISPNTEGFILPIYKQTNTQTPTTNKCQPLRAGPPLHRHHPLYEYKPALAGGLGSSTQTTSRTDAATVRSRDTRDTARCRWVFPCGWESLNIDKKPTPSFTHELPYDFKRHHTTTGWRRTLNCREGFSLGKVGYPIENTSPRPPPKPSSHHITDLTGVLSIGLKSLTPSQ